MSDEILTTIKEWVLSERQAYRASGAPLSAEQRKVLSRFYRSELLDKLRIVLVSELPKPSFVTALEASGRQPPLDVASISGLTLIDTIVIVEPRLHTNNPLLAVLFQECVHVCQFDVLGADAFLERYVHGWLHAERPEDNPLERDADELRAAFSAHPEAGFSVLEEVCRRLDASAGSGAAVEQPAANGSSAAAGRGRVRRARVEDLPAIVELCAEHARFERSSYDPAGKAERLKHFLFEEPRVYCLVGESASGEIVGYATFAREFSTWDAQYYFHIDCLYIRDGARDRGIGLALIKAMAREVLALGTNGLPVQWQTPTFNEPAIKLYHAIGASRKDKARFFLEHERVEHLAASRSWG